MNDALLTWHGTWAGKDQKAYYDVYWIMHRYLGVDWGDLHTKTLAEYPIEAVERLYQAIERYKKGEPLAYILETAEFYDLTLSIRPGVLIPRADTEPMVKAILDRLQGGERILELGTGSGAIACAIGKHALDVQITAVDQSEVACEVSSENVKQLGLSDRVKVVRGDWYLWEEIGFDWVIANPPYIAEDDPALEGAVKGFEPRRALISEEQGYRDLLFIMRQARYWLVPGGKLALEHGYQQQPDVESALKDLGYRDIYLGRDEKHPRFVLATI